MPSQYANDGLLKKKKHSKPLITASLMVAIAYTKRSVAQPPRTVHILFVLIKIMIL